MDRIILSKKKVYGLLFYKIPGDPARSANISFSELLLDEVRYKV
jgi:hypothetical protein